MAQDSESHDPLRSIDLNDADQVAKWCAELNCTQGQLGEAVWAVGPTHVSVEQWIRWQQLI
jgi:hypothetical protein